MNLSRIKFVDTETTWIIRDYLYSSVFLRILAVVLRIHT